MARQGDRQVLDAGHDRRILARGGRDAIRSRMVLHRTRAAAGALVVMLDGGCAGTPATPPAELPEPAAVATCKALTVPSPRTPYGLRIATPGAEPRVAIRFGPRPGGGGAHRSVVLELRDDEVDEREAPVSDHRERAEGHRAQRFTLAVEVTSAAAAATRIDFAMDTARPVDPEQLRAIGLHGQRVSDPCGVELSRKTSVLGKAKPDLGAWLRPIVVPIEPVGVGARWQVVSQAWVDELAVIETASYELASRDARHLVLAVQIEQTAAAQPVVVASPAVDEPHLELLELTGKGTAALTVELATDLPSGEVTVARTARYRYGEEIWAEAKTSTATIRAE